MGQSVNSILGGCCGGMEVVGGTVVGATDVGGVVVGGVVVGAEVGGAVVVVRGHPSLSIGP